MKYDYDNLKKKINDIKNVSKKYDIDFKNTVNFIADIDYTNVTRELKYSMYDVLELLYEIENDKYRDLISNYSKAYLEMSDFYVGENLPKSDFKKNLIDIYIFMFYILENCNVMTEYDVD